jgi:hypothetical protein
MDHFLLERRRLNNGMLCQRKWNHCEQEHVQSRPDRLAPDGPRILLFQPSAFAHGEDLFSPEAHQDVEKFSRRLFLANFAEREDSSCIALLRGEPCLLTVTFVVRYPLLHQARESNRADFDVAR